MNLLFEIADRDIMFILFIIFGILLFVFIIFYVMGKGEASSKTEKEELFTNIKPVNQEQEEAKEELERVFRRMNEDLEKIKPQKLSNSLKKNKKKMPLSVMKS